MPILNQIGSWLLIKKLTMTFEKQKKHLDQLKKKALELQKEADFNQFQLDELSALALQEEEQTELESKQEILENAEEIKLKIQEASGLFEDEQFGILQGMEQIQQHLQSLERLAHTFGPIRERFQSALIEVKDILATLEEEDGQIEVDFEKLEEIRERLSKIYQLQKKHGVLTVEELIEIEQQLADQVFEFQNLDESLEKAGKDFLEAEKAMQSLGEKLTKKRTSCFSDFEKSMKGLLQDLGMENAQIKFQRQEISPSNTGLDQIEVLFSANKGGALQALKKVASGGEFSRLLFAIKYLMADKMALPTLIFDEIDAGISGEVALQMVRMMKDISAKHQIICITHLPQVAAKGDMHYFVFKDNSASKTISKIKLLDEQERIQELAKMIAGAQPSENAIQSARELLAN